MPETPEEKRRHFQHLRRVALRFIPYGLGFWISLIWCMVAWEEMSLQIERPDELRFHSLQWWLGTCPLLAGLWLVRHFISRWALRAVTLLSAVPLSVSAVVQYYHTRYLWHPSYFFPIVNGVLALLVLLIACFIRKEETMEF